MNIKEDRDLSFEFFTGSDWRLVREEKRRGELVRLLVSGYYMHGVIGH